MIGINYKHLKSLQDFQGKFIRNLLRLAKSTPKVLVNWDTGLRPKKWRIVYEKLVFLQKILGREPSNICKKAILKEVSNGIHGLFLKMNEKLLDDMKNSNRSTDNPQDKTFIHCLSIPQTKCG